MIISMSQITCLMTSGTFMTSSARAAHVVKKGPNSIYLLSGAAVSALPHPLAG